MASLDRDRSRFTYTLYGLEGTVTVVCVPPPPSTSPQLPAREVNAAPLPLGARQLAGFKHNPAQGINMKLHCAP